MNSGKSVSDNSHVWLPSTRRGSFDPTWSFIARAAKGVYVEDTNGREYIDLNSGLWNASFGYDNDTIIRSIEAGLHTLTSASLFRRLNEPAVRLAGELAEALPHYARFFFANSGSEAADVAISISHAHWKARNQKGVPMIGALPGAYHGVTRATLGLMGIDDYTQSAPSVIPVARLPDPFGPSESLASRLHSFFDSYQSSLSAVFIEAIQGSGGVRIIPDEYLRILWERARLFGTLIVTDEVATGFFRTGIPFASQRLPASGDMIMLGKALTGGYVPMSAVGVTDEVFRTVTCHNATDRLAGFTNSGHPLACAAALGVLDLLKTEAFEASQSVGERTLGRIVHSLTSCDCVAHVRGCGHMYGVQLKEECIESLGGPEAFIHHVTKLALDRHILIHPLSIGVIPVFPALTSTTSELETMIERLNRVLKEV
jgi:adenosylmethionine-8-amino-7-oxononanoate aminotransferase